MLSSRFDATSHQITAAGHQSRQAAQPASPWVSFPSAASPVSPTHAPVSSSEPTISQSKSSIKSTAISSSSSSSQQVSNGTSKHSSQTETQQEGAWAWPPPHWAHLSHTPSQHSTAGSCSSSTPDGPGAHSGGGDDSSVKGEGSSSSSAKKGKSAMGMSTGCHSAWPPTWAAWDSLHGWRQVCVCGGGDGQTLRSDGCQSSGGNRSQRMAA